MGGAAINSDELKLVDRVERIELARKIGQFLSGNQQGQDRATGEDLARMLAADTSVAVREALALELRNSSVLPADLVERIARDLDQVAVPFLIAAKALTDDLLEQIVRECGDAAQEAIARRDGVMVMITSARAARLCGPVISAARPRCLAASASRAALSSSGSTIRTRSNGRSLSAAFNWKIAWPPAPTRPSVVASRRARCRIDSALAAAVRNAVR